jgi:predicted TIM-barrel fold metal-dependent hydrolase
MIIDYGITPPVAEMFAHYQPFPPHLANYNRIFGDAALAADAETFLARPFDEFMSFVTQAGVDRFVVKACDIESTFGIKTRNETVAELVRSHPDRVIGFAGVDPHKGIAAVEELSYAVEALGLRGLNLQLYELKLPAHDKRIYPLYAKCVELDIPVNIHSSGHFSSVIELGYGHPLHLDEVAVDFPELRIIASPPGWPWVHELIAVAWRHPNVYIALSSLRAALLGKAGSGYEPLLTYGNSVLQDKLIFGSGWPLLPLERSLAEFRALGWKAEVIPKLLGLNALRALEKARGT